jgi:hypothetical protein
MDFALSTLKQLRDSIKLESRLAGTTDTDPLVNNTINELLLEYCYNNRYLELLTLNIPLPTIVGVGKYILPSDFHLISNVKYQGADRGIITLYPRKTNLYLSNPAGTRPKYYEITGTINSFSINLIPFADVADNESIIIDYYSLPPLLIEDDDTFPIARLLGPLKQKAIYRMLLYNTQPTQQTSPLHKQGAAEDEARSKPSN